MGGLEIVKTGAQVIGTLAGISQAAKANRAANAQLDNMQRMENSRYYNNMGDAMHRGDVAELSKQVYDNIRSSNQQALNPMNNNTTEGANAIRQQNTEMTRQMAATVNADNTKLRMENENQHVKTNIGIAEGRANAAAAKAQAITKATSDLVNNIQNIDGGTKPKATATAAEAPANNTTTVAKPAVVAPAKAVTAPAVAAPVDGAADVAQARQRNLFDGLFG